MKNRDDQIMKVQIYFPRLKLEKLIINIIEQ